MCAFTFFEHVLTCLSLFCATLLALAQINGCNADVARRRARDGIDITAYCDHVDEMAASIVRLSTEAERAAATHRTSDGEKHRKVLSAWKRLVDTSTETDMPRSQ